MLLNDTRIRIFEEFLRNYETRLTGSFIARKKNLNQKSVANALKEFEEQGFLKSITEGKNKLYFLNLEDKQIIIPFIAALENLKTINFYKREKLVKEITKKISPYCEGIVAIFGSYAKGIQKEDSDLDIFIAGKYDQKEIEKISERYRVEINIKHYPLAAFKKALSKKDPFIEEVITAHILVKNIQQFVSYVREFRHGKD